MAAAPTFLALLAERGISERGDEAILEYITGMLEDEDFEFGEGGCDAFDAIGPFLVEGGFVGDDGEAEELCKVLAERCEGGEAKGAGAGAGAEEFRLLEGGPRAIGQVTQEDGRAKEGKATELEFAKPVTLIENPELSEKDLAKLARVAEKEERKARTHQESMMAKAAERERHAMPTIVRTVGGPPVRDIRLEKFSVSNGGEDLIQDATVTLAWARRYGFIGRNGTGKSTMLRALSGRAIPGVPKNCQILHVEQEVTGDDQSVIDCVLQCDVERTKLLDEEARLLAQDGEGKKEGEGAGGELARVYARLNEIDAYTAEARAATILAGLSFEADMQLRATKTFSGGWRMRIALARALFVEPDLLLLDEPTNHLDLHAVLWLEDYLQKWPKTLIVVSHARDFLNNVVTDIIHLQSRVLTAYKGDYDTFEKTRAERARNQAKAHEAQEARKKQMQGFIDKFRFNAKRASLVQSRIKALDKLTSVDMIELDPEYVFSFPDPDEVPPPILGFNDVDFAYPGGGRTIFKGLDFGIDMDSRLAIVGPNGIGKTTLLNLIVGNLEPSEGFIQRSGKVRFATFSQHHVEGMDLSMTPLQYMVRCFRGVPEQSIRSHLGSFGVTGTLAIQPMYSLSGGQKSRVAFAKVTYQKPHILLLDEPSNHLDIDAVNALALGLSKFRGGILMVSHDEHLISATMDELWAVHDGSITPFHGTFDEYKARVKKDMVQK